MAENEEKKKKGISGATVAAFAIAAGAGLTGLGLWKFISWLQQRDEVKSELIQEYLTELEELMNLQESIALKGYPISDLDNQRLDTLTEAMAFKEHIIESYNEHWLTDLVHESGALFREAGIFIIEAAVAVVAGYIIIQLVRWLFRNRPPRPPTFRCEKDGLVFPDEQSLEDHVKRDHLATTNPQLLESAQAQYDLQPAWVQELIAAEAGVYRRAGQPWTGLTTDEVTSIVYGCFFAVALGLAGALMGPSAALLLI